MQNAIFVAYICQLTTMDLDGDVGDEANVGRKTYCPGQYHCYSFSILLR